MSAIAGAGSCEQSDNRDRPATGTGTGGSDNGVTTQSAPGSARMGSAYHPRTSPGSFFWCRNGQASRMYPSGLLLQAPKALSHGAR